MKIRNINIYLVLGLILAFGAPYIPDVFFWLIEVFDTGYEMRFLQIIPSVRTGGILLFIYGTILKIKKENVK